MVASALLFVGCGLPGGQKDLDTYASLIKGRLSESRPLEKKYMSHLSQFSLSHGELCSCRTDEASVTAIWRRCCPDNLPGFMGCLPRLCLADNKFASRTGAVRED